VHFDPLAGDLPGVLARARAAGLAAIITVGTDAAGNRRVADLVACPERSRGAGDPMLYAAVGFHPHVAAEVTEADWSALEDLLVRPKVIALGEFGLDFHYKHSPQEAQGPVFRRAIRLARDRDLPLIIHSRDAASETLAALDEAAAGRMPRGVFHCFTGSADLAREALARGFYISFSGILTFPNSEAVREAARRVPVERVLVETDSPYCAPVPLRGKVNEPAHVVHVVRALADLCGLTEDDVRRVTTRNACHLFGLPLAAGVACFVYPIRRSLYVNLTNRCSNRCTFCPRSGHTVLVETGPVWARRGGDLVVKGHDLALEREPTAEEILQAIAQAGAEQYDEIVFCGFGEPTLRLDVVKDVARGVKEQWPGRRIRLNTNGQGSAINGRDIIPELVGLVDSLSVSLDAADAAVYERLCRPTLPNAFAAVCDFVRAANGRIPEIRATAVAVPGLDLAAVRRLAEQELGVAFEVRAYNVVG